MQDAISALDPSFLDEMRGIAQGAGVRFEDILALNCRTEILPAEFLGVPATQEENKSSPRIDSRPLSAAQRQAASVFGEGECTALALKPSASAEGNTWLAQNWDWIGTQRQALVLLKGRAWNQAKPDQAEPAPPSHTIPGREFLTLTDRAMWIAPNVPSKAEFEQVI